MNESLIYFSKAQVKEVAHKMSQLGRQYEQLFTDLGTQMFTDMVDLDDACEMMTICNYHIEQALSAFGQYFPDTSVIACIEGCHHCCSFPIECPPQVVIDIARYLRSTRSIADLDILRQKLVNDINDRKLPLNRAQCPFIDSEKMCSIYEKRPLSCQWFTSPDAAICEKSVVDGRNIPQHHNRHRIYQVATTMLLACAKEQGRAHEQVLFVQSLLSVLEIKKKGELWKGYVI